METLRVTPSSIINIGYSDKITFNISLVDATGKAIVGAPVIASFVGDSSNASLTPATFHTSEQGTGQVTFVAPDKEVSFAIRFKSPEDEESVEVVVDRSMFSITLDIEYSGNREMDSLQALLYRDTSCDELIPNEDDSVESFEQGGALPTSVFIDGLQAETSYTILVNAKNEEERIRASGCVDGISPSKATEPLELMDTRLFIAGQYTTQTRLEMPGVADLIVDRLADRIELISSPEMAILNGIESVLSDDPFAQETFNQQREELDLGRVLSSYFRDESIDIFASLETTWSDIKTALSSFDLIGTLELEPSQEGNDFTSYHTLERFRFYQENDEMLEHVIHLPDTSRGTMEMDPLNIDTLIWNHETSLGLGVPLSFLFTTVLQDNLGTQEINGALLSIIDCDGVTAVLEPHLADVTTSSVIQQGCQRATDTAQEQLNAEITELNQYDQLSFKATCQVEVPITDEQVNKLESDDLSLVWGDDENGLYEMYAESFEANRVSQQ
jgi:hypothetical protein